MRWVREPNQPIQPNERMKVFCLCVGLWEWEWDAREPSEGVRGTDILVSHLLCGLLMLPARTPPPGVFLSIVFWFCARETHYQVAWIATLLFTAVVVASVVLPIVYQKNIKIVYAPV